MAEVPQVSASGAPKIRVLPKKAGDDENWYLRLGMKNGLPFAEVSEGPRLAEIIYILRLAEHWILEDQAQCLSGGEI